MKKVCLVCNAHLDPVWQWEWEEGLAEALSTFRIAADFCEEFDGFVFNHNESVLYQWVEEYEPELFARIQRLVEQGRWHIMGGWYIQPDCNMPSGESIMRQIMEGRRYFSEKFGKEPTTAINFDSFGHSRGLVQILAKAGYDSYLVCRPELPHSKTSKVPARDFSWVGYDGSKVAVHLADEMYASRLGRATEKIDEVLDAHPEEDPVLVLWGVGNHGGGPSRMDLQKIGAKILEVKEQGIDMFHATPEEYFAMLDRDALVEYDGAIGPSMIGCYTSQVKIKQKHRQLENMLYSTEKLICAAELQAGYRGNWDRIREAQQTLLFNEFHDVLPGTTVKRAEEASLRSLDYAMEILSRERMKAFMAFASGADIQKQEGDIPILVFNTHPYPVKRVISCEFQLQDQNHSGTHTAYQVYHNGKQIPAQLEKEDSTIPLDWRKKLLIEAELPPFALSVFICRPVILPEKPQIIQPAGEDICLQGGNATVRISRKTGWIQEMTCDGKPVLQEDAGKLLVIQDNEDPWGMTVTEYRNLTGAFTLADGETSGKIAGLDHAIEPVRVIEDGAVRTVVEAIFTYDRSAAIVHYRMEKQTGKLSMGITLQWLQPSQMVKLSLKPGWENADCYAQDMFGRKQTECDGKENVNQKWLLLAGDQQAVSVINTGIYAHDFFDNELRITLMHSPGYCAHPLENRVVLPQDRFLARVDTGERHFELVLTAGDRNERLDRVDREALEENESPFALSFFPTGKKKQFAQGISVDNEKLVLSAFIRKDETYQIRLYNPTDVRQGASVSVGNATVLDNIEFAPFEVKTLELNV